MKLLTASLLALLLSSAPCCRHNRRPSAKPDLAKLTDSWPTYNGDYSGRRYSPLTKINTTTVKQLSLAWSFRVETTTAGGRRISATPLEVNGVLYFTVPSHVWAVDARTGRKMWQFDWASKGGETIGNRGAAVLGRHGLLRDGRLQPGRHRHQHRQGEVARPPSAIPTSSTSAASRPSS